MRGAEEVLDGGNHARGRNTVVKQHGPNLADAPEGGSPAETAGRAVSLRGLLTQRRVECHDGINPVVRRGRAGAAGGATPFGGSGRGDGRTSAGVESSRLAGSSPRGGRGGEVGSWAALLASRRTRVTTVLETEASRALL